MKMSKFKVAFTVLLIATVIWVYAFWYTLQEYHKYVEKYGEWGLNEPYYNWNGGKYVCISGGVLCVAWTIFLGEFYSHRASLEE